MSRIRLKVSKYVNAYRAWSAPKKFRNIEDVNFSPLFIIGTNRSGTSITSSLLSQHPELEGLFSGITESSIGKSGHSVGFCESSHIWVHLFDTESDFALGKNYGILWGHPKYISNYYRDDIESKSFALSLINLVQKWRKTDLTPLIKDQWNMLRIGMIRKTFPNAKFLFVVRDYKEYIKSCNHKWHNDNVDVSQPNIGLHWQSLNETALYDLMKFAPNDHTVLKYETLLGDKDRVQASLNRSLVELKLKPFEFDLSEISKKFRYQEDHDIEPSGRFSSIQEIIEYEKSLM